MTTEALHTPTYRPRHPVAFLTYPGASGPADPGHDLGRAWRPPRWLPDAVTGWGVQHLPLRPRVTGTLRSDDNPERPAGWVVTLPLTPAEVQAGSSRARRAAREGLARARDLGALTVGLGGHTAALLSGADVPEDVGLTAGGAFRAALCVMTVRRVLSQLPPGRPVAVVGTGLDGAGLDSTGLSSTGLAHTVATLLATDTSVPLLRIASSVDSPPDLRELREAGVVVLLDAAGVTAMHLGADATVLDETQPRWSRPALLLDRPDVCVLDGSRAALPGVWRQGAARDGAVTGCACVAEALLLGLAGHVGHFSVGEVQPEHARRMLDLAARFARLGFAPAAPRCFGAPVMVSRRFEPGLPGPVERRAEERRDAARAAFPRPGLTP